MRLGRRAVSPKPVFQSRARKQAVCTAPRTPLADCAALTNELISGDRRERCVSQPPAIRSYTPSTVAVGEFQRGLLATPDAKCGFGRAGATGKQSVTWRQPSAHSMARYSGYNAAVTDSAPTMIQARTPVYIGVPPERFDREERANAAVHGVGLLLGLVGMRFCWLLRRGGEGRGRNSAARSMSSPCWRPMPPRRCRTCFAIPPGGSECAFSIRQSFFCSSRDLTRQSALKWLRGGEWWILNCSIWGLALVGFLSKSVFRHRVTPENFSTVLHIAIGWVPVLAARPLMMAAPGTLLLWFLAGGVCYTIGTIFFFRYDHKYAYFHAIWHAWVIAGSACQYLGILFYCAAARGG